MNTPAHWCRGGGDFSTAREEAQLRDRNRKTKKKNVLTAGHYSSSAFSSLRLSLVFNCERSFLSLFAFFLFIGAPRSGPPHTRASICVFFSFFSLSEKPSSCGSVLPSDGPTHRCLPYRSTLFSTYQGPSTSDARCASFFFFLSEPLPTFGALRAHTSVVFDFGCFCESSLLLPHVLSFPVSTRRSGG